MSGFRYFRVYAGGVSIVSMRFTLSGGEQIPPNALAPAFPQDSTGPNWANVPSPPMSMDVVNSSPAFLDEAGHSIAACGSASISATNKQFGVSSGYFNGVDSYLQTAAYTTSFTPPIQEF